MSAFDPQDNHQNRFSDRNPVVETVRIVLNVSDLPVGHVTGLTDQDLSSDDDFVETLLTTRELFPGPSSSLPASAASEDEASSCNTITTQANIVTMGGSTMRTTEEFVAPAPPPVPPVPPAAAGVAVVRQQAQQEEEREAATGVDKNKRKRFKYSKKYFYATSDIYLKINPEFPPPESTPELVGMISQCPTKKNNNHYEVTWVSLRSQAVEWPLNLRHHLRTLFSKESIHANLASWIEGCERNSSTRILRTAAPAPTAPINNNVNQQPLIIMPRCPPPAPAAPPAAGGGVLLVQPETNINYNTPAARRPAEQIAFAALYTAASAAYSDISSLGHSNRSPPAEQQPPTPVAHPERQQQQRGRSPAPGAEQDQQRGSSSRTRRTRGPLSVLDEAQEQDSDDNETDDEAGYDVNFHENFWQSRATVKEIVNVFEDDGDQQSSFMTRNSGADSRDGQQVGAGDLDYGALLRDCSDFQFREISREDEEADCDGVMSPPPKIYNEEMSGLRRGIASAFDSPITAFRQAGFTLQLVARWTKNSNR
jgi:hypothetical protein